MRRTLAPVKMASLGVPAVEADSMAHRQAAGQACQQLLLESEALYNLASSATLATAVTASSVAKFTQACHSSPLTENTFYLSSACYQEASKVPLADSTRSMEKYSLTTEKEVRYGIIGTGMMGIEHALNLAAIEGARVTAVADSHEPSRLAAIRATGDNQLRAFADHRALLESGLCDVVVVATPNMTHAEILLDILHHSSPHHILVEKPLCTNIADCKRVLAAAQARKDVLVNVGLEYRYMPPIARLISEVKKGAIGRILMVAIREHRFPFLVKVKNWNRFTRNTGGTLVEKCCHFFDLMNLITGSRPIRVMASGSQAVNHLDESYDGEVPDILDNAYVIVEYENGARGLLDLCMFAEGSRNEQEVCVTGNAGKIEAHVPESVVHIGTRSGGRAGVQTIECRDERIKYDGLHHGSSYLEHLEFIKAVQSHGKLQPFVGLEEGVLAVAVGVAAHKSIELGRPIMLEEVMEVDIER